MTAGWFCIQNAWHHDWPQHLGCTAPTSQESGPRARLSKTKQHMFTPSVRPNQHYYYSYNCLLTRPHPGCSYSCHCHCWQFKAVYTHNSCRRCCQPSSTPPKRHYRRPLPLTQKRTHTISCQCVVPLGCCSCCFADSKHSSGQDQVRP
jgi:hypothetical protein